MNDVYEQLRERLDNFSTGFPITKNGSEMKVLKRLFSPNDAQMFLNLSPILETPGAIASRLKRNEKEIAGQLEDMAQKGLLFRLRKTDSVKYSAVPFIIGILEYQLNRIDKNFVQDVEEYFQSGFLQTIKATETPLMRTVPINESLDEDSSITPFDDIMKTIDEQKTVSVMECICRKSQRMIDQGCNKPMEACFQFGSQADYFVQNGIGRYVTPDQAKAMVKKILSEAPLVIQMANTQKGGGFCMCCGDCCGMLRSLKMQPNPAEMAKSNYQAVINSDECNGCEICIDCCQMEAISVRDGVAVIDYNRCIGCGNCVMACPIPEALHLEKKQAERMYTPPENFAKTYMEIARERGKL